MRRRSRALAAVGFTVALAALAFPQGAPAAGPAQAAEPAHAAVSSQRALLERYCVTCHNGDFVRGTDEPRSLLVSQLRAVGLALDDVDIDNVAEHPEVWEKVVRKLRVGAMPPQPRPRPDKETYDGFRRWLEDQLDAAAAAHPNPGRTQAFHRLNQTEYRNVIRDLLHLDIDVEEWIPADAPDRHGFDNNAGVLSLSPALLDRYVSAARKIGRLAIGLPPAGGAVIQTWCSRLWPSGTPTCFFRTCLAASSSTVRVKPWPESSSIIQSWVCLWLGWTWAWSSMGSVMSSISKNSGSSFSESS